MNNFLVRYSPATGSNQFLPSSIAHSGSTCSFMFQEAEEKENSKTSELQKDSSKYMISCWVALTSTIH